MELVLLGTYSARRQGARWAAVTLPSPFLEANGIKPGDLLDVYTVKDDPTLLIVKVRADDGKPSLS